MKLREDMVVHKEIISEFLEEDFIASDDEALLEELKARVESLGFDSDEIVKMLKGRKQETVRRVDATSPFPVIPQKQRKEARRRLNEEIKRTAKILLNRLELDISGRELSVKYAPGVTGNNYVAAVQMLNREVDKKLGIKSGQRGKLKTEDFVRGKDSLDEILNGLTRTLKKRMGADNE